MSTTDTAPPDAPPSTVDLESIAEAMNAGFDRMNRQLGEFGRRVEDRFENLEERVNARFDEVEDRFQLLGVPHEADERRGYQIAGIGALVMALLAWFIAHNFLTGAWGRMNLGWISALLGALAGAALFYGFYEQIAYVRARKRERERHSDEPASASSETGGDPTVDLADTGGGPPDSGTPTT